jgi:hypothetical protein
MLAHFGELNSVSPATKEQRDLLFQKMKEAGYEWDTEKKELRKVEQKSTWSEEDEKIRKDLITYINSIKGDTLDLTMRAHEWLCWLEKQKEKKPIIAVDSDQLLKILPRTAEWSEEDEKMINLLIKIFEVNHPNGHFKVNPIGTTSMEAISTKEIVDWLKSIKPQSHWKHSEEQMGALNYAYCELFKRGENGEGSNCVHPLMTLIDDLKKL